MNEIIIVSSEFVSSPILRQAALCVPRMGISSTFTHARDGISGLLCTTNEWLLLCIFGKIYVVPLERFNVS
jgi:hypothetical protein